jgi:hypothetical protein
MGQPRQRIGGTAVVTPPEADEPEEEEEDPE